MEAQCRCGSLSTLDMPKYVNFLIIQFKTSSEKEKTVQVGH